MAELNLRVCEELHERITAACDTHCLNITEFCRKAVKQYFSGKLKPVIQHELIERTTYNGKFLQARNWEFAIKGRELTEILVAALLKLEAAPVPRPPVVKEIEGVDYYVERVKD
jgi:hypothetical protein